MTKTLTIELISTFTCRRCVKAQKDLQALIKSCDDLDINYQEVNVLEQLDYAVKLGVLRTPAIAINGELVFNTIPNETQFHNTLHNLLS
jgi:glutaredoxin